MFLVEQTSYGGSAKVAYEKNARIQKRKKNLMDLETVK
jgi:hypothetical protein